VALSQWEWTEERCYLRVESTPKSGRLAKSFLIGTETNNVPGAAPAPISFKIHPLDYFVIGNNGLPVFPYVAFQDLATFTTGIR
jgi:hypothetical protein